MKKITLLALLLTSQIALSASTLECLFAVKKKGNYDLESVKKSVELKEPNLDPIIIAPELNYKFASLDFESTELRYKITISASSSTLENRIEADIKDLKKGTLSTAKGINELNSTISRTDSYGDPSEGVAAVCTLK